MKRMTEEFRHDDGEQPDARLTDARHRLRIGLLQLHPHCSCCGQKLVAKPGEQNTAVLIVERLSCQGCAVEAREKLLKEVRQETSVRRLASAKRRYFTKATLVEVMPFCCHCGRELNIGGQGSDSACLVFDRLACPAHVRAVREAAFDAKVEQFAESGQSIPQYGKLRAALLKRAELVGR